MIILFKNKILQQIWKNCFLLNLIHILFFFSYSWTTLQNPICRYHENWQISCKSFDLLLLQFYILVQFRAKKCFILNECAISCKSGFVLIQNWCEISYKKSHFVQKHETVAQENLLFRGNSSFDLNFLTSFREKKLSFCHKLKFTNPYIFATWKSKHLIFQT